MKPEDKKCLKQIWLGKILILTGTIGIIITSTILDVSVALNLYTSISQRADIRKYSQICPTQSPISTLCNLFEGFITISEKLRKEDIYPLLLIEFLAIGASFTLMIYAFPFSLNSRKSYPLSWSVHMLLPEETIAELIALKRRRQKQNLPQWKLLLELTVEVLLLLWAIHIQIRLQNLNLPPSKKRNID
jgi:hypothetical protein